MSNGEKTVSAIGEFINAVERLAFEMRPANAYTPRFVQMCVEMRSQLARSQSRPTDETCPRCKGGGCIGVVQGRGEDAEIVDAPCPDCGATGAITRSSTEHKELARQLDHVAYNICLNSRIGGTEASIVTKAARLIESLPSATPPMNTAPTEAEVAAYRDCFRAELDKNMNNSSASPSTDAHRVALTAFLTSRRKAT